MKLLGLTITLLFSGIINAKAQYVEGFKITASGDKYGFTDQDGKVLVPPIYDKVYDFSDGRALVKSGKWGMIDRHGEVIISTRYDNIILFSSGDVAIDSAGKKGIMNNIGKILCPPTYDDIMVWYGLFIVKLSDKWGMIDREGDVVLPIVYDGPPVMTTYEVKLKKDNTTYSIDYKGEPIK